MQDFDKFTWAQKIVDVIFENPELVNFSANENIFKNGTVINCDGVASFFGIKEMAEYKLAEKVSSSEKIPGGIKIDGFFQKYQSIDYAFLVFNNFVLYSKYDLTIFIALKTKIEEIQKQKTRKKNIAKGQNVDN